MLTPHRLRRLVATFFLALVCIGAQAPAAARSQEANFIRFKATVAADLPYNVRGDLFLSTDGNIYFTSIAGGAAGLGSIGKLAPDGTLGTVYAIATSSTEGRYPQSGVTQASDGNLYGTNYYGGANDRGTIFRVTLAGEYTVLYAFGKSTTDPQYAYTGLVQASDGNLYGTTLLGGALNKGTVFKISLAGAFSIVHEFNGTDGENPEGRLIIGGDGALYGTTMQGGSANRGTIYRITVSSGALESLYSFPSLSGFIGDLATNAMGANPRAALLLGLDGNYYGTAYQGGPKGMGTVFRMNASDHVVSLVHAFTGASAGGKFPLSGVAQDSAGNLYGTTRFGGYLDLGSAWRIDGGGQFSLLHGFTDVAADGQAPYTTLLPVNGGLYGASSYDATLGRGAVFKLDLGSNGQLPVEFAVSPTEFTCVVVLGSDTCGTSPTITWSSPTAASCTATGSWTNGDKAISGSEAVTPTFPAIYNYVLNCTDGAGVVRSTVASLSVKAPVLDPVDGGGGTGSMSISLFLLLAALLIRKQLKEIFTACP